MGGVWRLERALVAAGREPGRRCDRWVKTRIDYKTRVVCGERHRTWSQRARDEMSGDAPKRSRSGIRGRCRPRHSGEEAVRCSPSFLLAMGGPSTADLRSWPGERAALQVDRHRWPWRGMNSCPGPERSRLVRKGRA
jgi:hypothetical protein